MPKKTNKQITQLVDIISVYEGDIPIKPSVHEEYIEYHGRISIDNYDYEKTFRETKKLFEKDIPWEVKKKLLFLLGEFATPECFQILKRYLNNEKLLHKEWALLALQELRFHIENELYEEGKDMVMSPIGGKRNMLRYYVVVSKKKGKKFSNEEKNILKLALTKIAKQMQSEAEDFEFNNSYVLIKMLTSVDVASGDVIDALLDECKDILRYHYFMVNTHKPTKKEIDEYLGMDSVKEL